MNSKTTLPFGTWPSSISADIVASAAPKINHIQSNGTLLTWVESRPNEGGRNVIMGRTQDGLISDLIPRPYSHYSRVHEYGGMAYTLSESCIYFDNASDQSIYQKIIGAIGVVGPTRLNYSKIVPLVDYTSKIVGKVLS